MATSTSTSTSTSAPTPTFFDLATPDPEFSENSVENEDQIPGRPMDGQVEIDAMFDCLKLLVTSEQRQGPVNGNTIFDHFKGARELVLGPNFGKFLFLNQHLIPEVLQDNVTLIFWGKVYRGSSGRGHWVRCLYWDGDQWRFGCSLVDSDGWDVKARAVVLVRKS